MLLIRAHHLFCIQGYQGYGYDESFSENMDCVYEKINEESTCVQVCDYVDDICKKCPNLKNGICINYENNQHIVNMDRKVLSKLDSDEERFKSSDLFNLLNNGLTADDVSDVCGDCMWIDKCLFYQKFFGSIR